MNMSKESYWMKANALALCHASGIKKLKINQFYNALSCATELAKENSFDLPIEIISNIKGQEEGDFDSLNYSISPFYWTNILLASTSKGICFLGFIDAPESHDLEAEIRKNYPKSKLIQKQDQHQLNLLGGLMGQLVKTISLHLLGTAFQHKVWEELLYLQPNELITYKELGTRFNAMNAYRAVGTAVGKNPISLLIPCHQVIGSDQELAGYRWGLVNKLTLLIGEKGIHE